jgi:hypothetical protein
VGLETKEISSVYTAGGFMYPEGRRLDRLASICRFYDWYCITSKQAWKLSPWGILSDCMHKAVRGKDPSSMHKRSEAKVQMSLKICVRLRSGSSF